jgi:Family of unknown function (DUF6338)
LSNGLSSVAAFLLLIAPGLAYQLVRERLRPTSRETTFREAANVALLSVVLHLLSSGLVLAAFSKAVDVPAWIREGHKYVADNLALVAWMFGLEQLLAFGGAVVLALLLARTDPEGPKLQRVPMWYWAFRENQPLNTRTFAQVTLRDGTQYWGYIGHYTSDDLPIDERELELCKPVSLRLAGHVEPRHLPDSVDRVLLAGETVQAVLVVYHR